MLSVPLSARLALWASAAYAGRLQVEEAVARANREMDHVAGALARITLWRDLGERVVLVALPRPGDATSVPRGNPELTAAATDAGQCVFVPGVGGALVPVVEDFGPVGDRGTSVRWTPYDCDPWPQHRVEELSVADAEQQLRRELAERTAELDALDVPAFGSRGRQVSDERLGAGGPGLPDGLPPRAQRTISLAAQVAVIAEVGLSPLGHTVDSHSTQQRTLVLTALQAAARRALETGVNVGALGLAGWR